MKINNKGFTLLELIMVVAILAIIAVMLVPNIMNFVTESKKDTFCELIKTIESTAETYVSENKYTDISITSKVKDCTGSINIDIPIQDLINKGYLNTNNNEKELKNPITNKTIILTEANAVTVEYNCDSKKFISFIVSDDVIFKDEKELNDTDGQTYKKSDVCTS